MTQFFGNPHGPLSVFSSCAFVVAGCWVGFVPAAAAGAAAEVGAG